MLSQKREQQSLFYTALHKSAFKELDPVGEPDMRMSSDSGVKTETNTQREEEPWAFTKEGQSSVLSGSLGSFGLGSVWVWGQG